MTTLQPPVPPASSAQGRKSAYQVANWHIVRAGLVLAGSGIPKDAPELRALSAALRAVNQAGGIEEPMKEVQRVYPAAGRPGTGRPGKVA